MRTLSPAPDAALDPVTGSPRVGSYRGALAHVDLRRVAGGALQRMAREKRWVYVGIATSDVYVGLAVVRLGYAANAFAFAYDSVGKRMIADVSLLAPPFRCEVGDTGGEGCVARLTSGRDRVAITRAIGSTTYVVDVQTRALQLEAELDCASAPPSVTAIAALSDHRVNTTEKRTLLSVTGALHAGGARRSLDGALGGYDYTHGLLERRTQWRWGFALGRAVSGEKIAFNLVEGFVGEPECALWIDDELHPLAEGRFEFDAERPLEPWRVRTADGGIDLRFAPGAMHADRTNFGFVKSRFVQPAGVYSGTIRAAGRELILKDVLGVSEDQDVLW
jgi:hypothetical protein